MTHDQNFELISPGAILVQPAKGLIRVDGNIAKNRLDLPSKLGKTDVFLWGHLIKDQMFKRVYDIESDILQLHVI